jgi:hypothetical protein
LKKVSKHRADLLGIGFFAPLLQKISQEQNGFELATNQSNVAIDIPSPPIAPAPAAPARNPSGLSFATRLSDDDPPQVLFKQDHRARRALCSRIRWDHADLLSQCATWHDQLAQSFLLPRSPLEFFQAWTVRFRRIYVYLFGATLCAWLIKLSVSQGLEPSIILPIVVGYVVLSCLIFCVFSETVEDV